MNMTVHAAMAASMTDSRCWPNGTLGGILYEGREQFDDHQHRPRSRGRQRPGAGGCSAFGKPRRSRPGSGIGLGSVSPAGGAAAAGTGSASRESRFLLLAEPGGFGTCRCCLRVRGCHKSLGGRRWRGFDACLHANGGRAAVAVDGDQKIRIVERRGAWALFRSGSGSAVVGQRCFRPGP